MHYKIIGVLSLISLSFQSIASTQLHKFDEIKNNLLQGQSIKAIVTLNDGCRRISTYQAAGTSLSLPTMLVIPLEKFIHSPYNITASTSNLNPASQSLPANYTVMGITISTNGRIDINVQTLAFQKQQVINQVRYNCTMDEGRGGGVKFFTQ